VLNKVFFTHSTDVVAQKLLGMHVVRVIGGKFLVGKIVETESYTYHDPASHCYQKRTERNKALFGPVGHAYIYKIYGIHYGFNVVAHSKEDVAGGVLIRAIEPIEGIEYMREFRQAARIECNRDKRANITNGPGKLTQALQIDLALYGHNLMQESELYIIKPENYRAPEIQATPRIGISKAPDLKKRFIIKNNGWVTPHVFNKL